MGHDVLGEVTAKQQQNGAHARAVGLLAALMAAPSAGVGWGDHLHASVPPFLLMPGDVHSGTVLRAFTVPARSRAG